MRQRNDTTQEIWVQNVDPQLVLAPGDEIDHPDLIVGMTAAEDDGSVDLDKTEKPVQPKKSTKSTAPSEGATE